MGECTPVECGDSPFLYFCRLVSLLGRGVVLGEVGGGRVLSFGCVYAEVRDRCFPRVHTDDGPASSI